MCIKHNYTFSLHTVFWLLFHFQFSDFCLFFIFWQILGICPGGGWAHLELTEPLKKSNPIFHIFSVDPVMRVHITVEPRFTGTRLIRNIASNDSFSLSLVEIKKALTFSSNSSYLIQILMDNYFLQTKQLHSPIWTLLYPFRYAKKFLFRWR